MTACTDDERREVAERLRANVGKRIPLILNVAFSAFDIDPMSLERRVSSDEAALHLADLIEPTDGFDLDTVQRVCFECMEGCDEPEWTLYTTIYDAIARYKRGDSGPTYDRAALLALADEMERIADRNWLTGTISIGRARSWADRIREALGIKS